MFDVYEKISPRGCLVVQEIHPRGMGHNTESMDETRFIMRWDHEPRRDELCESHVFINGLSYNSALRNERFMESVQA